MTTGMIRESAKIYQFPKRNIRDGRDARFGGQSAPEVILDCCSASWYHEEAIREAVEPRKQ